MNLGEIAYGAYKLVWESADSDLSETDLLDSLSSIIIMSFTIESMPFCFLVGFFLVYELPCPDDTPPRDMLENATLVDFL